MRSSFAMDLTSNGEDGQALSEPSVRFKALKMQEDTKPGMLVLSPPCRMFPTIQNAKKPKV